MLSYEQSKSKGKSNSREFLIVYEDEMISLVKNKATWVVDSGALSHVTPYRDIFISYTPGDFRRVKMGNGLTSKIIGKQNRVQFKSYPPSRKENILDLVYSDVCGPMKTQRVGGPFDVYCREFGIRHHKTPPKTPQLNRIAKRLNRTLIKGVRCLLSHAKLPAYFWGEALSIVVHVLNKSSSVSLNFEVPKKVWTSKEVSYNNLHVFGGKSFMHIPKDERSKLESKSRQCVFIGYKLYDPIEKKASRVQDIPFQVYEQNDSNNEQDALIQFDDQDNQNDGHEIPMHDYEQNDQPNVLNDQQDKQEALIHVDEEPDVVQPRRSSRER
ncbi:retrovirus-related pol polyprotein from transposon TNT 1-94 [Tanacetum coccineum]